MVNRLWSSLLLTLAVAASALVFGCSADPHQGWSTMTTHRTDVSSIAVPIFVNETFHRSLEFELTDALVKEIQSRTPYRIAPTNRADTVLIGTIRKVELDRLSKSRQTRLAEEMILSVTIDFRWEDRRTGKSLVIREDFTGNALFVPSRPTAEPIEIGQFAVVQQLARDVVEELEAAW